MTAKSMGCFQRWNNFVPDKWFQYWCRAEFWNLPQMVLKPSQTSYSDLSVKLGLDKLKPNTFAAHVGNQMDIDLISSIFLTHQMHQSQTYLFICGLGRTWYCSEAWASRTSQSVHEIAVIKVVRYVQAKPIRLIFWTSEVKIVTYLTLLEHWSDASQTEQ